MTSWEAITWDVARAGGFTAYALLTLSVAVGLALTLHWQSHRWPRIINAELHNFLSLLALIFTAVHVLAVWVDPFTRFGVAEVFIPFVSHYRALWMAFGIVALYLGIAIGISTWLRPLIGYAWWRRLHVLTLGSYALVTVHGLATGSDTRTFWALLLYAGSVALVGTLLCVRLLAPATPLGRSHPVFAALTGLAVLVAGIWTILGPVQSGWNAIANDNQGSGARVALAAPGATATRGATGGQSPQTGTANGTNPFSSAFSGSLAGTLTQSGPDNAGVVTLRIDSTLSGGAQGTLTVELKGQSEDTEDGGSALSVTSTTVTLGTNSTTPLYKGPITDLSTRRLWRLTATLLGTGSGAGEVQVQVALRIDNANHVTGTIQGTPVTTDTTS